MAGPHPRDIATLKPKLRLPLDYAPVKGMRIALSIDLGYCEVDEDVHSNTLDAAAKLREAGATVDEVEIGWSWDVLTAAMNYLGHLFGNSIAPALRRHRHELMPYTAAFADFGAGTTGEDFLDAQKLAGEMYDVLGPLLSRYDALVCPTNALAAVPAEFDSTKEDLFINGVSVDPMLGWVMTYPFNIMSRCPVLTVPSGFDRNHVPTGLQIVGRTYDDPTVFRIGHAVEAADPWYTNPARRPDVG